MVTIDLNTLLTGQDANGTWGITSPCGDTATNPDTIDLTNPTNVIFAGKTLGTYTFYYSFNINGCTPECTAVTVEVIDCCDVVINSIDVDGNCPATITINYTTASIADYLYVVIEDSSGTEEYRELLDPTMAATGTHTLTITGVPCEDVDVVKNIKLCCTNQRQLDI